jgi:hypothetical protein
MVADFRRKHGDPAADSVPFRLLWIAGIGDRETRPARRQRAEVIIAKTYPGYDIYRPPFANGEFLDEQQRLMTGLAGVRRSEAVDAAVVELFRTVAKTETKSGRTRYELDQLAFACIERLVKGKYDDELRAFLAARAKACEADDNRARLIDIRKWQARLRD